MANSSVVSRGFAHLSAGGSGRRPGRHLVVATILLALVGACSGDASDAVVVGATADATPIATAPAAEQPALEPVDEPTSPAPPPTTPAESGVPPCGEVPSFTAADSVAVACVDRYAVSPELFASGAGWHLYEASGMSWVEIDYARTCCGADEVPFTELLGRNRVDDALVAELCRAAGLAADPQSGCNADPDRVVPAGFEADWLRVNGFGDNDFGTNEATVVASLDAVFGRPIEIVEAVECGAGPMRIASFDDFSLQFQDDGLVGWFYRSSTPPLETPSGVAPGLSEAALLDVYQGVEIFDETLGKEFVFTVAAGFMGGFFDDAGASVQALYAGTNCFFR